MRIFVIDDDPASRNGALRAVRAACPDAETSAFPDAGSAIAAVRAHGPPPDAVFCAAAMPGMSGLAFAVELRKLCPRVGVVFVTAFRDYAADAYRIHADGYVIKPLTAERVREELDNLAAPRLNLAWGGGRKVPESALFWQI